MVEIYSAAPTGRIGQCWVSIDVRKIIIKQLNSTCDYLLLLSGVSRHLMPGQQVFVAFKKQGDFLTILLD